MLTVTYSTTTGVTQTLAIAETATAKAQTAAIQSALSFVAVAGGGTVSLSAGTWIVAGTGKAADGCLKIGSNTSLEGAGMGQTFLKLADGSSAVTGIIRTDSGKTKPDGTYTTVDNVAVRGLSIDGNKAATFGDVDGFYCGPKPGTAQADTNIALDRVEIMNCSRYGFDPHEQTVGLSITNSSAHHNGVDGFTIDFCSNVTLANNTAYANGRHGFNLVTGTHDVVMTGNVAHDNGGSGIAVQTGDNEIREFTSRISISGGSLYANGRAGVEVKQATDVSISGVTINGNTNEGVTLAGVEHVALANNFIGGNGGTQSVKIAGYLQDFGDTDAANDRWIATRDVTVDGAMLPDPVAPVGTTPWAWKVTTGDDSITGSAGRDVIATGSGNDFVNGGAGDDLLYGNDGADTLDGGAGNDKLYGGAGDDRLMFAAGVDTLDGGSGSDWADFTKFASAVMVDLAAAGFEATSGGAGIADLVSIENVKGTSFADVLIGNGASNVLDGGGGADLVSGGAGNDTLAGSGGNDTLGGGSGNDVMTGGTGSDVYSFNAGWGSDVIADFTRKADKIDFAGIAGLTGFEQLGIAQSGADAVVTFGSDQITLLNAMAAALTASDFTFH